MVTYLRLSSSEREVIYREISLRKSLNEIARLLSRAPSTISREIDRMDLLPSQYSPILAESDSKKKQASRKAGKKKIFGQLAILIEECLLQYRFSPEQSSQYLYRKFNWVHLF